MIYIYHHTDDDGYASAATVITYHKLNNDIEHYNDSMIKLIPYNYEDLVTFVPFPEAGFQETDIIYLVDLSVSVTTLNKFILFLDLLHRLKCRFIWIDHHRSSVDESFNNFLTTKINTYGFEKYINIDYCAAYNCYKYLIIDKLGYSNFPEILRIIDDYDCWKLKLANTKEFLNGFALNNRHNPNNSSWYLWLTNRGASLSIIKNCIEDGHIVNSWLDIDDTTKFNNFSYETTFFGLHCCVLNVRRNSDIFRTKNNYDALISFVYNGENYIYSIYSKNESVYCNKIAEILGGGGHKGAAGFTSKKLLVSKKQNIIYKLKDKYRSFLYQRSLKKKG